MSRFSGSMTKYRAGLAALAAVAAISVTAQPATAGASVSSDSCTGTTYWARLTGEATIYVCGVSTRRLGGSDIYTLLSISNHRNRVWLHQHPDGSGWAICFEGPDRTFSLNGSDENPGNIQIVSNTAACGE